MSKKEQTEQEITERKLRSIDRFNYGISLIEEGLVESGQLLVIDFKNKCLSSKIVTNKLVTKKKTKKKRKTKSRKKAS